VIAAGFLALAWRPEIEPIETLDRASFDEELIRAGQRLAAVGNCIACHTVPGEKAFAGGLELPTPFGTIYSTNITPDPETGIGRWSEAAFIRAMREGVDREGNHLYPAFPYDHYTRVTDEDNRALYAYLMTREPVAATPPENELRFPLGFRPLLAGWKLLFFEEGVFRPSPEQSEEWNRGAYLAEGLGHCGSCHTPRNRLGALDEDRHYAGGEAEGWRAYAIDENSPAPIPWDRDSLAFYLRHGWHEFHGVSRGPMAEVTGNLGGLPDPDVNAIATYVAAVMGEPTPERRARAEAVLQEVRGGPGALTPAADSQTTPAAAAESRGAAIYGTTCAPCHESGRPLPYGGLHFALSAAVNAESPQNIVNVTLFGLPAADGEASSVMPGFAGVLSDEDMAELLRYMRERFSEEPEWTDLPELVRRTRTGEHEVSIRPSDGIERAPHNVGAEE
jgi:mono/diheme cytochrome c family protein